MARIENLKESWEQHTGSEVEEFIKDQFGKKVGWSETVQDLDGNNVIAGFADEESYLEWLELGEEARWGEEGQKYLIARPKIPSAEGSDVYTVTLATESNPAQTQKDKNVTVNVKATSKVLYAAGGEELINEVITLVIQTRTSPTASWAEKDSLTLTSNADYAPISLAPYLVSGTNYIRMRAIGEYATSIWKSFQIDVVNLSLVPNMALEIPMTGSQLQLNYLIGGVINKRLQLEFGAGRGSEFVAKYTYLRGDEGCDINIGTEINLTTGKSFTFTQSDLMSDGRHTVRARLYSTEDVKTEFVETEYMVVNNSATAKPMVIINNAATLLANWSDVVFFNWSAYTRGENMQVIFRLKDFASNQEIANWSFMATPETSYSFATQLGLELDSKVTEFYGYMTVEDEEGNELSDRVFFTITNTASFAPVEGADFVLQPANRSNSEANPQTVINAMTGEVIPSTWENFDMKNDGYMEVNVDVDNISSSAETVRALHLPAGRHLTINYNPLKEFINSMQSATGLSGKSMTLEIDFRTSNILDENESIIKIGSIANDGDIHGFEAKPLEACLMTALQRVRDDQNVSWAEGVRTRLSINLVYGLNPDNNPTGTKLNYARIFINEGVEREFNYTNGDRFLSGDFPMVFGADNADLDIFSIRCYQKALSTNEVMQDYKAGLSFSEDKLTFQKANDILGDDGAISFEKAKNAGYNVIGHTGHLPTYGDENKGKTEGISLDIYIDGEPERSGKLTNLTTSGQGTTAMTYYFWNPQYKHTDKTEWFGDDGNNERYGSQGYAIAEGEPLATKEVGKMNFASSMQSHKLGLTWAYTDLFKHLVSQRKMSEPGQIALQNNARISVLERPFLFFHREKEGDPWTFRFLVTFGAGKGDKSTFGFDKKTTPNMLMVEGADNDRPLALFAAPWNGDVEYSESDEAWMYAGQKNLNFGFGLTAENSNGEYPSSEIAINKMKGFWNFVYLHHTGIKYYNGTLTQLRNGGAYAEGENGATDTPVKGKLYWITTDDSFTGASRYDLFRWDFKTNEWVNAGVNKEKLNIRTQYEQFCSELETDSPSWTAGQWASIGSDIKNIRWKHFKEKAEEYMHVDDALYHSCFIKFFAGTDNRAKNTYYYTDPTTLKIRWMADDLDTVLKTNNVGQNRKPYYVEEHDKNEAGEYYWHGEESGLYNLLEEAFEDEMTQMMKDIMSAMTSLGGSVMGFMEKYLLSTQDYFPGIAYNETARLVYERASVAQADGIYQNNAAQAITQSNGSQRWSEYQWLKDRIMYISSWCEYGEFSSSTDASGSLSFRGTNGRYAFKLTPAKWMYPRVGLGSDNLGATPTTRRVRVKAGEEFAYQEFSVGNDTSVYIRGIDYMLGLGDFNIPLSASQQTRFEFLGKRLQEITVNPNGSDANQFAAQSISISNATNIKKFIVRGVDTLRGGVDLSKCTKLTEIDLLGSTVTSVTFPTGGALTKAQLPASLESLSVVDMPNLKDVTLEGTRNLTALTVWSNDGELYQFDTYSIVLDCYESKAPLSVVKINGINWKDVSAEVLRYLADMPNSDVRGKVAVYEPDTTRNAVTFDIKLRLISKWGNIDDEKNDMYITYYYRPTTALIIAGNEYLREPGTYQMEARPTNLYSNDVQDIKWSMTSNSYATINEDTGVITMDRVSQTAAYATVTATYYRRGAEPLTVEKRIGLFDRPAAVGDFVYCNGEYSDVWDGIMPVIGVCFYINPSDPTDRRMVALKDMDASYPWGLYSDNIPNIVLNDTPSYSAYDTPLPNIGNNGTGTINDANYLDANAGDKDGFKIFAENTTLGGFGLKDVPSDILQFKAGQRIPDGQYNTAVIIKHRDTVLNDSNVNLETPVETQTPKRTEFQRVSDLITDVINNPGKGNGKSSYQQYYFPPASYCYAYEPSVNKEGFSLADKFKKHNWWLPSCAELARLYWYHSKGYTNGVDNAIFAKARTAGLFAAFSPANYWSATEYSNPIAWNIHFSSGTISNVGKFSTYAVRAVAAF